MKETLKDKLTECKSLFAKVPEFKTLASQKIQVLRKELHTRIENSSLLSESLKKSLGNLVDPTMDEDSYSVNRLQRLQEKKQDLEDSEIDPERESTKLREQMEFDENEKQSGVVRWCGNEDRFIEQKIRTHKELSGAFQMFEIDPIMNMPDEDKNSLNRNRPSNNEI